MAIMSEEARAARREYMRRYKASMSEEQREALREYQRAWRKANPEKIRANTERYWLKKGQEMKEAAARESVNNV